MVINFVKFPIKPRFESHLMFFVNNFNKLINKGGKNNRIINKVNKNSKSNNGNDNNKIKIMVL